MFNIQINALLCTSFLYVKEFLLNIITSETINKTYRKFHNLNQIQVAVAIRLILL